MKAHLSEKEPQRVQDWENQKIYQKLLDKRKGKPLFFMPDGPPYANGTLHMGHALNKTLKDIVIKYKNLKGFQAPFIPSWDCHGLPIELEAFKKLKKDKDHKLKEECRKTALYWVKKQEESFKRLGILADWDKKLLTMDSFYSAQQVRAFAKMVEKGLIFSGRKPVFWCFKLQTALAFSEAEYREHESPSIYVKFNLSKDSLQKLNLSQNVSAVIWTTTPWTLPANTAICLHPDLEYGLFTVSKESYLLALALAESFFKEIGISDFKKEKVFKGKDLENLTTQHPFLDSKSVIVLGEHVGQETGTGLVHTAPGHGLDDYNVGLKYKLPMPCPVSASGHFTKEAPDFLQGLFILKANQNIIDKLKESRHLLSVKKINHSYPYNPRSNTPLIYRLTPQWFLALDKSFDSDLSGSSSKGTVRQKALKACEEEISFVPDWGKARLKAMLQNSPDWCLSRQRTWGVPIVVFYCKSCSKPLLSAEIINKIASQMEETGEGINYYFNQDVSSLLPPKTSCSSCGSQSFKKGTDILDVWFDSGVQHEVLSKKEDVKIPFDLFLEGSDQHRGWFQTSLLSSIAIHSKSPFKTLLTHSFITDQKGHKMSKSKGNAPSLENLIQQKGSEIIRLWLASENFAVDIRLGEQNFKRVTESYRRYRNSFRFILGNLHNFNLKESLDFSGLKPIDQWLLIQLSELIKQVTQDYEDYAFYRAYQRFNYFFTVTLSSFYLNVIKDRLYTFPQKSLQRRQAQTVLHQLLNDLIVLMAPITSFLSEEVYSYFEKLDKKESVFLEDFPSPQNFEKEKEIKELFLKLFPLREHLNKELETLREKKEIGSNLEAQANLTLKEDFITKSLSKEDQLEFFSVSQITIQEGQKTNLKVQKAEGEKCLRCWFISPQLNEEKICPKCVQILKT